MVPVVAQSRREPLSADHIDRAVTCRGADLLFGNLKSVAALRGKDHMKPGHAAALVLVAWCLIMPPLSDDYQAVEKNAPLSKWDTIGS